MIERMIYLMLAAASLPAQQFQPLRADGNGIAALAKVVSIHVDNEVLRDALRLTARRAGVDFSAADLPALDKRVSLSADTVRVAAALMRLVGGSDVELLVSAAGPIVVARARQRETRIAPSSLRGVVLDSAEASPVASAIVELKDASGTIIGHAATAQDGRFTLRGVSDANATLSVRHIGYLPNQHILGDIDSVEVRLVRVAVPLSAIVVSPGFYGVMEQTVSARQTLTRDQLRVAPQLGEDLYRSVNRLPGVAASDYSAAFRVRGGANRELYSSLDGQELIDPFHLKDFDGAISIIDVGAIAGLDLTTGGFGARYGDRLTGVMTMRTIDPPASGKTSRTELAMTLTSVRATSYGGFDDGRGGWLFSARRGFLDYAMRAAGEQDNLNPRYYDVLGKVTYRLTDAASVSMHFLRADDRLSYQDGDKPRIESAYGSTYAWMVAKVGFAHGLAVENVLSAGALDWQRLGTGTSTFDGAKDLAVRDDRSLRFGGVRQDWSWDVATPLLLTWGGELKQARARYDYHSEERILTAVNRQAVATNALLDVTTAPDGSTSGGYVSVRAQPASHLTLDLGARADHQSYTGESEVTPRVGASFTPVEGTTLRAAWGLYAQPQALHELQTQFGEAAFHRSELAEQRGLGIEQRLGNGVVARVEAYDRVLRRLQPHWVSVDNSIDVFPEIEPDRVLLSPTRGDARGVELLVTRSPGHRVTWSASYALAKTTDIVNGRTVPRTLDQRHTIALDAGWRPSPRWQFSAAWLYHTGWPTTPFTFVVDTLADGRFLVNRVYAARNTDRLAPYHRLDLRATRDVRVRDTRFSVFVDLFNVYDRHNPRAYDAVTNGGPGHVRFTQRVDGLLPRLPSFGLSWEF